MNDARRKEIKAAIKRTEDLSKEWDALKEQLEAFKEKAQELRGTIEDLQSEEDEYRENMHENLHQSERYYNSEAASEQLGNAMETLDEVDNLDLDAMPDFDSVVTALDEAAA